MVTLGDIIDPFTEPGESLIQSPIEDRFVLPSPRVLSFHKVTAIGRGWAAFVFSILLRTEEPTLGPGALHPRGFKSI